MSSPISSINGSGTANWSAAASPTPTQSGTSGPSFAQFAAAAGLTTPPTGTGGSGGTGQSGTGTSNQTGGPNSGQPGGFGGLGSTPNQASGTANGTTFGQNGAIPGQSGQPGTGSAATGLGTGSTGSATGTNGTSGTSGTSGTTGSGSIADLSGTDTFLKLLVAQLKNQDPTSPMDDQSFVTELAQFNTVEQMINLKQAITAQTTAQQATEGIGLLGRQISYTAPGVSGNQPVTNQGTVTGVSLAGGQVSLQVGSQQIAISEVTAVT